MKQPSEIKAKVFWSSDTEEYFWIVLPNKREILVKKVFEQ